MFIKVRFVDMCGGVVGWLDGAKAQLLKVTGLFVLMIFVSKRPNYAVLKPLTCSPLRNDTTSGYNAQ